MKLRHTYIIGVYPLLVVLGIATLLGACRTEAHDDPSGVVFSLSREDSEDADTPVDDIRLSIFNADGSSVRTSNFTDAAQLTATIYPLPSGSYTAVTLVNCTSPFVIAPASITLSDPDASPAHGYYSVTPFTFNDQGIQVEVQPLTRVLAEFNVTIEDAPEGSTLAVTVEDAAIGLFPLRLDAEGRYGVAATEASAVHLPIATAAGGVLNTAVQRLMPTVSGHTHSHLKLELTMPDGTKSVTEAEAPLMKSSGRYELTLRYDELKSFLRIEANRINDWTEGWSVTEEITDPEL